METERHEVRDAGCSVGAGRGGTRGADARAASCADAAGASSIGHFGRRRRVGRGAALRCSLGLAAGVLLGLAVAASGVRAEEPGKVVVKPLASATITADGQPIRLPQGDVRVALSEYLIPAGAKLPVHKHPFTRLAYVLEGTLSVTDVDAGKTWDYKPGDLIVEVVDRWHSGTNTGTTPVRLLVVDQAPDGAATTIVRQ